MKELGLKSDQEIIEERDLRESLLKKKILG